MMFLSIVFASLLGSLHCAAMCGGIATVAAAGGPGSSRARRLRGAFAYHGGRGLGYVGLGAIAGSFGAGLDRGAMASLGVQDVAAVVMGAVLLVMALRPWLSRSAPLVRLRRTPSRSPVSRWLASVLPRGGAVGCGTVGLLTGALPCGWLWSFLVVAAGTAHAEHGALVMLAMWLGTLPSLVGVTLLAGLVGPRLGRLAPKLTSAVLVVVAIATMTGRLVPHWHADDDEEPTCCHHP